MTVVVVGSLNLDLVVGLQRMPNPGETVFGDRLERFAGGKGLNQTVAAARAGARVAMIGAVGSDDAGAWLLDLVVREGIDGSAIRTVDGPTGTAIIEVDPGGMNRIVVVAGANAQVDGDQVQQAIARLDDPAVVLVQHEVPSAAVRAAMRAGRDHGAVTILNPAPARDLGDIDPTDIDLLVPNEHEAAHLAGMPTADLPQAQAAAARLLEAGFGTVVITRGANGVIWSGSAGSGSMPAFEVTAVDTVAAGDAFCGGLAASLAEGLLLPDALRRASAGGALAASASGAVPSLPYRTAIDSLAG